MHKPDEQLSTLEKKTVKELLEFMLKNQKYFVSGLCSWVVRLYFDCLISHDKHALLERYIIANRPSKYSSIDAYISRNDLFFWKPRNIKPRIKWIKKHIKKLSK